MTSIHPTIYIHTFRHLIRRESLHEGILKTFEIDTTTKQKQKQGKRFL